jgi:hypothetical protein
LAAQARDAATVWAQEPDVRVVPDVANGVVSKENAIVEREVLQEWIDKEPINQDDSDGKNGKANGNVNDNLVGLVTVKNVSRKRINVSM